jgi:hypothetical protein
VKSSIIAHVNFLDNKYSGTELDASASVTWAFFVIFLNEINTMRIVSVVFGLYLLQILFLACCLLPLDSKNICCQEGMGNG